MRSLVFYFSFILLSVIYAGDDLEFKEDESRVLCLSLHTQNTAGQTFTEAVDNREKIAKQFRPRGSTCFVFSPPLTLVQGKGEKVNLQGKPHYFDTIPCTAWVRSFVKSAVNPRAWWDPERYSLEREECKVEMLEGVPVIKVNVDDKDWTYLGSQVQQYLLSGKWGTNWYYPYVNDSIAYMVHFAINRRFQEIEKKALESAGFVDVKLERGVHPETQQLQWMIFATSKM